MQNTRLWEAFQSLSRQELRAFERFAASPWFNRKEQLRGLAAYLQECLERKRVPEAASAYAAAYPEDTGYNDQKMRLANSDLLALLEAFWLQQAREADTVGAKAQLASAYRKRGLPRHAAAVLREGRQALEAETGRAAGYFEQRHALEWEAFQQSSVARRYEHFNLQEISDLLDTAYLARKLRQVCLALSHQAVFKTQYDFGPMPALMAYLEHSALLEVPAIALYYHACRFLADPGAEGDFRQFYSLLGDASPFFPEEELRALYLLAINFGVKKSNDTGKTEWYRIAFDLYQDALDRDLLLENGQLSRFAYNNIVGFAMRLGATDWAEHFIHHYKPKLGRQHREAAFSMNMARVAYARGDYGQALLYLQKADYKDFINGMNARILQMKIYYEHEESDLLESHLDSMQHYIRRQRAAGYHRENYLNIVQCCRALLRCRANGMADAPALRRQIEAEKVLTERDWFLERV